jgi:hypothetical protein
MMTTFQVSKWFIYQKHKLNGAHRNIMTCTKNSSILTTHYINVERIERERERERERESLTSTPHSFLATRFRVFRIKGLSPCQAPEAK